MPFEFPAPRWRELRGCCPWASNFPNDDGEESAGRCWWEAEAKREQGSIRKEEEKNVCFMGKKKSFEKKTYEEKGMSEDAFLPGDVSRSSS